MPDAAIAGGVIHYETAGEGPPLVLLHGIGSNSRSWRRQLDAFSSRFRVIAWDAPGYGRSSDPPAKITPAIGYYAVCLEQMLDSIDSGRIFLLGHSMGGAVAQEFYRRYPEYVRALVLADTRYSGSRAGLQQRLDAIRAMSPAELAAKRAPRLLSPNAAPEAVREAVSIMSDVRRPGYEFAALALAESDTRDVMFNLLRVRTLLIWGDQDEITPLWNERPPGARVEIISGAGHLCYIEQPERFNKVVMDFLAESL